MARVRFGKLQGFVIGPFLVDLSFIMDDIDIDMQTTIHSTLLLDYLTVDNNGFIAFWKMLQRPCLNGSAVMFLKINPINAG